jgi:F0F1-type ATP synthase membrane subunit a
MFNPTRYPDLLHIPLFTTIILSTLIGYLWFLIQYPSPDGDTIKATYVLQIFPFMALLIGSVGARLSESNSRIYPFIFSLFVFTFVHNLGSLFSRYIS